LFFRRYELNQPPDFAVAEQLVFLVERFPLCIKHLQYSILRTRYTTVPKSKDRINPGLAQGLPLAYINYINGGLGVLRCGLRTINTCNSVSLLHTNKFNIYIKLFLNSS
jgi:hypothetical protein